MPLFTVSSGIGSKMFDRKSSQGVIDHLPYAGEIGHIVINDDAHAPVCDCGAKGHLQAIASGRGIERAARREAPERCDARSLQVSPIALPAFRWYCLRDVYAVEATIAAFTAERIDEDQSQQRLRSRAPRSPHKTFLLTAWTIGHHGSFLRTRLTTLQSYY